MPTVFLSYRRIDAAGEAGRLADALQLKLGRRFVFRDVVSISPGDKFDAVLEAQLATAAITLVLIGPAWLQELGKRSAQESSDYHRLEVAAALRGRKRVIPVLLGGAGLPPRDALPEDLQALTRCQAITIRDEAWSRDVDRLIDAIGHPYRWDLLVLRVLAAGVVITLGVWKLAPHVFPERASDYAFWRALVLALSGVYGLVESSIGYRHFRTLRRLRRTAP
jgi:TIR domain